MGLTNETDQIRTVDQPCDGGAWRVSTFRRRPRKCNGCVQPRRLPLCSTVGAECHHAVEVDTVGLGFYGSQPVPGVYEREASATNPGPSDSTRERYRGHVDPVPAVLCAAFLRTRPQRTHC